MQEAVAQADPEVAVAHEVQEVLPEVVVLEVVLVLLQKAAVSLLAEEEEVIKIYFYSV